MIDRRPDSADSPSDDPDDQYVEVLKRYDEDLKRKTPDSTHAESPSADTPVGRERLFDCLDLLERAWPRTGAAAAPTARPQRIGRFLIERTLGQGGFGIVFLAIDPELNRQVALKVPRLHTLAHPEMLERFRHEARAAASLDHPHIVPVYETGEADDVLYIASAFCPGPTLAEWLTDQPGGISSRTAALIISQLAGAVAYSHLRGILHRDLKPANVILVPLRQGADAQAGALPFTPRLTDFGLAKLVDAGLTVTGNSIVVGTPLYMSPEQAEGASHNIGPATDVFALGAILYELLTGRPPYDGDSLVRVLDRIRSDEEPVPPDRIRRSIPADLATVCLKCLRKDPAQRYSTAGDLATDLQRFLEGEPVDARKLSWLARFGNWARRPQRIRDAGVLAIVVNGAVACTAVSNSLPVLFNMDVPMPVESLPGFLGFQTAMLISHAALAWNGARVIRDARGAVWIGAATSLLLWAYCLAALFGGAPSMDIYRNNPMAKYMIHWFLMLVFSMQLAAFLVALEARRVLIKKLREAASVTQR